MKSIFKKSTLLLLLTPFLFSCQKEDNFPVKYKKVSQKIGNVKNLKNGIDITDPTYLDNESPLFKRDYSSIMEQWNFDLEILSDSKVKIIKSDTSFVLKLTKKDKVLYIEYPDTILRPQGSKNLFPNFFTYKPLFLEVYNNSNPDWYNNSSYRYVKCIFLTEQNNELHLNVMLSAYVFDLPGSSRLYDCNNTIDTNYVVQSKINIAYLEGEIVYIKE